MFCRCRQCLKFRVAGLSDSGDMINSTRAKESEKSLAGEEEAFVGSLVGLELLISLDIASHVAADSICWVL